jgi:predicted transcriptional regulator of viral defense system
VRTDWPERREEVGLAVAAVELLDQDARVWAPVEVAEVLGVTTHQAAARLNELMRRGRIRRPRRGQYQRLPR